MSAKREFIGGRLVITADDQGVTHDAIKAFNRYKGKLGTIKHVEVRAFPAKAKYTTYVVGDRATLILSGLGIGYTGEGPRGLYTILRSSGIATSMDSISKESYDGESRIWES
jgi:hypothetical protein